MENSLELLLEALYMPISDSGHLFINSIEISLTLYGIMNKVATIKYGHIYDALNNPILIIFKKKGGNYQVCL